MTRDDILRRADANYFEAWRRFDLLAGGEARESDALLLVDSGLPVAMFNQAFVRRILTDPERELWDAIAFFDARRRPFTVRIPARYDTRSEQACEALGLRYSDSVPAMVLERMDIDLSPVEGLAIETVSTVDDLDHFRRIDAEAFDMPEYIARRLVSDGFLRDPDLELYLGWVDGKPVATSLLFMTPLVAGVYNVATLPDYRRRGIGEALTAHVVRRGGQLGCTLSVLQASAMGKPVYERMGYRQVREYRTYHRSRK